MEDPNIKQIKNSRYAQVREAPNRMYFKEYLQGWKAGMGGPDGREEIDEMDNPYEEYFGFNENPKFTAWAQGWNDARNEP